VRFAPFDTHTRSLTLDAPTFDVPPIADAAVELVHRLEDGRAVRLLGVRAEMAPPQSDPPT
jgi:DNA polymerase-4